jgi:hypothetical protein
VLGVAHQKVWRRFGVIPKSETRSGRANRRTESDVWAEIVEEIGCAPVDDTAPAWVSVGDRASDVFSYIISWSKQKNWHCLLRVSQDRVIQTADGVKGRLFSLARSMNAVANKTIVLQCCADAMAYLNAQSIYLWHGLQSKYFHLLMDQNAN